MLTIAPVESVKSDNVICMDILNNKMIMYCLVNLFILFNKTGIKFVTFFRVIATTAIIQIMGLV